MKVVRKTSLESGHFQTWCKNLIKKFSLHDFPHIPRYFISHFQELNSNAKDCERNVFIVIQIPSTIDFDSHSIFQCTFFIVHSNGTDRTPLVLIVINQQTKFL